MKRYLFFLLLLSAVMVAKAQNFSDDNIEYTNNWNSTITLQVKTPGGLQAGINALSESLSYELSNISAATSVNLKGVPNSTDFNYLTTLCPSITKLDTEALSSIPGDAQFASSLLVLIAPRGTTLTRGLYSGISYIRSSNADNSQIQSILLNTPGSFAKCKEMDTNWNMWSTDQTHIIGELNLSDAKSVSEIPGTLLDLSQSGGITGEMAANSGYKGSWKVIILPDGASMPANGADLFANGAWASAKIVVKQGSTINVWWNNCGTEVLKLPAEYLIGVDKYVDYSDNLSNEDKQYLENLGLTQSTKTAVFDGVTAEVDLSSTTLASALAELYTGSGTTPEESMKHLVVTAGSLAAEDLSTYGVLESVTVPDETAMPVTLPASLHYIYIKDKGVKLITAGTLSQAIVENSNILSLSELKLAGTLNASDLDLNALGLSPATLNHLDLSQATLSSVSSLILPYNWSSQQEKYALLLPDGNDNFADYIAAGNNYVHLSTLAAHKDGGTKLHVVSAMDTEWLTAGAPLTLSVQDNNAVVVATMLTQLNSLDCSAIDLSGVTMPANTNVTIVNNHLAGGVLLGTQSIYGNYTLSAAHASFTSYTLSSHISGDVDLSGSIYLNELDLSRATIDGSVSLPNASEILVTVASDDIKIKVMSAGVPESHITFNENVKGTVVERGNYVIVNYDKETSDFGTMLTQAATLAGYTKKIVVHATGGIKADDLATWKDSGYDVFFDFYDIAGTEEEKSAAITGLEQFITAIHNGNMKKPLGIILPKNVSNANLTSDQIADACVEFGGRYLNGISIMYVNKGAGDTPEEQEQSAKTYFNHGADITMMHSDLRSSTIYVVGTDMPTFINTSERIPESSRVTLLKVTEHDGQRDMEVTLHSAGNLSAIIEAAGRITSGSSMGNLVIKTKHDATLNNDDMTAQNKLTMVESLNILDATLPDDAQLTNSHFQYIVMKKGSADVSTIADNLKGLAQIDTQTATAELNCKTAADFNKLFSLLEESQLNSFETIRITGEIDNTALQNLQTLDSAKLIDLSDATVASGSAIQSLLSSNKAFNDRVAIILPTSVTAAELSSFQYSGDYSRLMTVAYYDDSTKNRLNVWTHNESTALENYSPVLGSGQTLAFLPKYNDKGTLEDGPYMNWSSQLSSQLSRLSVGAIDFNWVNISQLGQDFSMLNCSVHHIVVPTNTTTKAGGEYKCFDDETLGGYSYTDELYTVTTYKSNEGAPYSDNCSYADAKYIAIEPTLITYIRKSGTLNAAYHILNAKMQSATRLNIIGTPDCDDLNATALYSSCNSVDLHLATLAPETQPATCLAANSTVEYLALPDNTDSMFEQLARAAGTASSMSNLKAAGVYNTTTNTYYTHSTQNIVDGKQQPSVGKVTAMVKPNTDGNRNSKTGEFCVGLEHVVMSGYLCLTDIQTNNTVDLAGLNNASIRTANLKEAIFPAQQDMAFTGSADSEGNKSNDPVTYAGWGGIQSIQLPVSKEMDTLPAFSLDNTGGLTYLCLPGNYKHIEQGALSGNNQLLTVSTTELDSNGDGRGEELCYNAEGEKVDFSVINAEDYPHTVTLPEALESIKTGAFSLDEQFTDVYVLSKGHVPTCEADAFSTGTYFGWGGFNSTAPITRASYQNGQTKPFAILHWPAGTVIEDVKKYTDITRQYSIYDEMQNSDGDGNVLVWPNQTEYEHAYITAKYGYLWGSYDKELSSEMSGYQTTLEQLMEKGNPSNDPQFRYDTQYTGWHQFVLTGSVAYEPISLEYDTYKEMDWYSVCIPFDLTYTQLMQMFGVLRPTGSGTITVRHTDGTTETLTAASDEDIYPRVSTLKGVKRSVDEKKITLQFTDNLARLAGENKNSQWDISTEKYVAANEKNGDKIVMKAGYPYLIKPYVPAPQDNDTISNIRTYSKRMFVATGGNYNDAAYEEKRPYTEWKVKAKDDSGKTATKDGADYYYLFVGTYNRMAKVPEYSYFIANNGTQNVWYKHVWGNSWSSPWTENTSLIAAMGTTQFKDLSEQTLATRTSYELTVTAYDDPIFDANGTPVKARYVMSFDENNDETTGIELADSDTAAAVNDLGAKTGIYGIDGRKISDSRLPLSLGTLPKGIYIVNGRKVVVK